VELNAYEEVYKAYCDCVLDHGMQSFLYMLCICVKESRHLGDMSSIYHKLPAYKLWEDTCNSFSVNNFLEHISPESIHGNVTIDQLLGLLKVVYYDHSWSSSFGGKKWGNITDQVAKLAAGDVSLELLLDTVFTLAHNTGNIFNKGFMFEHIGHGTLIKILDVQRSGQMPEYVLSGEHKLPTKEYEELQGYIEQVADLRKFESAVNWELVNTLGAVGSYHVPKQSKDGADVPTVFVDFGAAEEKVLKQIVEIVASKDNIPLPSNDHITMVQIHPTLVVEKHTKPRKKKKVKHLKSFKDTKESKWNL